MYDWTKTLDPLTDIMFATAVDFHCQWRAKYHFFHSLHSGSFSHSCPCVMYPSVPYVIPHFCLLEGERCPYFLNDSSYTSRDLNPDCQKECIEMTFCVTCTIFSQNSRYYSVIENSCCNFQNHFKLKPFCFLVMFEWLLLFLYFVHL